MAYRTRCKGASCRAEIGMVQLASGRWHPVEGLEEEDYQVWTERPLDVPELESRLVDPALVDCGRPVYSRRRVLVVSVGGHYELLTVYEVVETDGRLRPGPARLRGLESHFGSCPEARAFSGQGGPR